MKILYTLLIGLAASTFTAAQDIEKHWKDFRNGTSSERVKACDELTRYYHSEAQDSLRILGEELFMYGIDKHYYPAIEQGKLTLADYFILTGRSADGISMAKALMPNMEERGDDRMLCTAARLVSQGYIYQKDAKSAHFWAEKSVKAGESYPDPIIQAEGLSALAEAYLLKNDTERSVATFRKYLALIKPYRKYRSMSAAYARLGDIYRLKGDMNLANRFFRYSMEYAQKSGKSIPLAHAINNMGIVYFELGDTLKARQQFEEAMAIRRRINDPKSISESFYNLGDYHYYIGQNEPAIAWYRRSLEYARDHNLKVEQADALEALAGVAESTGDFKGATHYLQEYIALKKEIELSNGSDDDELAELQNTIIRMEAQHEVANAGIGEDGLNLSAIKWEWVVIGILIVLLLISLRAANVKTDREA